jgi:glycosyltransferase involved in cell wall biosynthesis
MSAKVLVVGIVLKTFGGHTRFVKGLLDSGLPYEFVHFDPARPPKDRTSWHRPGYQELFDAGIIRAGLGAVITLYHMFIFPFILLKERPDVVHFAGGAFWRFWEYAVYILMCLLFGIRTIYHWLGNFDDFYTLSSPTSKFLIKRILEQVDRQIVLSELDQNCMVSLVPRERIHLLPSGVSSSFIAQFCDQASSLKQDEIRILFIGGRDPVRKGIFDILKALAIVVRNDQTIQLVLTGGGNAVDALEQATNSDIEDHISFLGYVSETQKIELYKSAAMLLLPSCHEGLPYVILEAMAAGLPVISTPVGGIPDVIEENVNGFLIEPGDYKALAQRILLLCQNGALRQRIGQANREKVMRHYSQEAIFKRLERIYDELCRDSA